MFSTTPNLLKRIEREIKTTEHKLLDAEDELMNAELSRDAYVTRLARLKAQRDELTKDAAE